MTIRAEIVPSKEQDLPYLGDMAYSLTCNVTVIGVDQLSLQSANITYYWFKNSFLRVHFGPTLSFTCLTYKDVGNYLCQVFVQSTSLPHDVSTTQSFLLTSRGTYSCWTKSLFLCFLLSLSLSLPLSLSLSLSLPPLRICYCNTCMHSLIKLFVLQM